MAFQGFSPKTIDFLIENKIHDDKEWYDAHKPVYRENVLAPFVALVEDLTPTVEKIDPLIITTPAVDKTISRIYRDTRFSKDKSRYRMNMWIVFSRDKRNFSSIPSFYFELYPDSWRFGVGFYCASPDAMTNLRNMILTGSPLFEKAREECAGPVRFEVKGDVYKRSKFPDQPEGLRNWLDRKDLYLEFISEDMDAAFSPSLPETIAAGFQQLSAVYELLLAAGTMAV